jgi:hypothetical protein
MLYLMIEYVYKESRYGVAYIIMFDDTGNVVPTTGILEVKLSNSDDYRGVLREFKSVNGWAFY